MSKNDERTVTVFTSRDTAAVIVSISKFGSRSDRLFNHVQSYRVKTALRTKRIAQIINATKSGTFTPHIDDDCTIFTFCM